MANSTEIGLDTSVVLRLLVGEPAGQSGVAAEAILRAKRGGVAAMVSDLVVMEAYFALQASYQAPKRAALLALSRMFESGDIRPEPGGCAPAVLSESLKSTSKPGFVDRMIHAQYRRHRAGMVTFEKASVKLSGATVLEFADPDE